MLTPVAEAPSLSCSTPSNIPFNDDKLPDPFLFNDGTRVRSSTDWACRRQQLSALIQGYEAGALPPKPPVVTSTFTQSGLIGNLTVTAGFTGNTTTFSSPITFPNGTAPSAGWPLVIAYSGLSLPVPDGVSSESISHVLGETNTMNRSQS